LTEAEDRRRAELVASLGAVRTRISDACSAAGRDVRSVTMVAVTKTYPLADVATLLELGVADLGESRDQEAKAKAKAVELSEAGATPRWHFVGRVQTNKAASIARYAHSVHSVDRLEAVAAFAKAVADRDSELEMFVQVSLDGDRERGGAVGDDVTRVADAIAQAPNLRLRGVMAVAPIGADLDDAFGELARISVALRADHPAADAISAGMSSDLEVAVKFGATHVRVGTALLGRRTSSFS
jgi:pyridoxal phosphate enzyme (YggS family)